jgi:5-methylthioadenosine/S-adenosylhomocysteine deaminase
MSRSIPTVSSSPTPSSRPATSATRGLPAAEALQIATGARAPVLGGAPELAVGAPADFVLLRAEAPELAPGHVVDNLVYAATGAVVSTTVVAGRVLMRDGVVDGESEVRARVVECARLLGVL